MTLRDIWARNWYSTPFHRCTSGPATCESRWPGSRSAFPFPLGPIGYGQEVEAWGEGIHLLDDWGFLDRPDFRGWSMFGGCASSRHWRRAARIYHLPRRVFAAWAAAVLFKAGVRRCARTSPATHRRPAVPGRHSRATPCITSADRMAQVARGAKPSGLRPASTGPGSMGSKAGAVPHTQRRAPAVSNGQSCRPGRGLAAAARAPAARQQGRIRGITRLAAPARRAASLAQHRMRFDGDEMQRAAVLRIALLPLIPRGPGGEEVGPGQSRSREWPVSALLPGRPQSAAAEKHRARAPRTGASDTSP